MSQMPAVEAHFGAPMGRTRGDSKVPSRRTRLFRVRLNSGGYDDGGAYWGIGLPLYCATDDLDYIQFLRAPDRWEASIKFQEQLDAHLRGLGQDPVAIHWAVKID